MSWDWVDFATGIGTGLGAGLGVAGLAYCIHENNHDNEIRRCANEFDNDPVGGQR